jgi:D-alanyl-D-alanine carboxypeptidase
MPRHALQHRLPRWAATLVLVAATALGGASISTPAAAANERPGVTDPQLQAALDAVVAAGASGVSVRVDDGNRTLRAAAGHARFSSPVPMRPDARLRVGSVTKTFVSTVTLQLAGEGLLGLDDTVQRWLPGLLPGGDDITLRQLLNHTSGVFNYSEDPAVDMALLTDPLRGYTAQELVAIAAAQAPYFPPGTGFHYSNTDYILLGMVVEQVTDRPLATLLRQRIIEPLRLRDTYLPTRQLAIHGYHARGYIPATLSGQIPGWEPGRYVDVTRTNPTVFQGAGALISTPDDLRTFYAALLSGRLLGLAQLTEMKTLVPVEPGFGYGLGLYSIDTPCGRVWGHDGGVPGYITIAWNDESGHRGFALGLPTLPDESIGNALADAIGIATCRMLGQPAPEIDMAAKSLAPVPLRLVDGPAPILAQ